MYLCILFSRYKRMGVIGAVMIVSSIAYKSNR